MYVRAHLLRAFLRERHHNKIIWRKVLTERAPQTCPPPRNPLRTGEIHLNLLTEVAPNNKLLPQEKQV